MCPYIFSTIIRFNREYLLYLKASMAITDDLTLRGAHLHGDYKLAEMHLHWGSNNTIGSEHSINGRKRPAEVPYYNTILGRWSHRYKHSTVVITIWFIVTICPYLIREWIFYFLHIYVSFFYHCQDFNRTWMHIWVTQWVSCKYQEQLTFPEHPMLPVSLNCPFIIAHLVFVNIYLINPLDLLNKIFGFSIFLLWHIPKEEKFEDTNGVIQKP